MKWIWVQVRPACGGDAAATTTSVDVHVKYGPNQSFGELAASVLESLAKTHPELAAQLTPAYCLYLKSKTHGIDQVLDSSWRICSYVSGSDALVYKRAPREYRVQISHRLLLDEEAPLEALLPLLLQHFGITIPPPSLSSSSSSSSSPSPTPDESDAHGSSSSYSLTHLSPDGRTSTVLSLAQPLQAQVSTTTIAANSNSSSGPPTLRLESSSDTPAQHLNLLLPIAVRTAMRHSFSSDSIADLSSSPGGGGGGGISGLVRSQRRNTDSSPSAAAAAVAAATHATSQVSPRQQFSSAPSINAIISPRRYSHSRDVRRMSVQLGATPFFAEETNVFETTSSTSTPSLLSSPLPSSATLPTSPKSAKANSKFKKWATTASRVFTPDDTATHAHRGRIFGVSLLSLVSNPDDCSVRAVPSIIRHITSELLIRKSFELEENIFRLSGNLERIARIKFAADSGAAIDFSASDTHDLACVLKQFLQQLPEPLLLVNLYHRFIACTLLAHKQPELAIDYLQVLVNTLPGPHRALLLHLLPILKLVSDSADVTKMNLNALGIVFGPLFLRAAPNDNSSLIRDVFTCAQTVELLVKHQEVFFTMDDATPTLQTIRALTSFKKSNPGELDVVEGDLLHLFKATDTHWAAEINGEFGTLPTIYIDALRAKTDVESRRGRGLSLKLNLDAIKSKSSKKTGSSNSKDNFTYDELAFSSPPSPPSPLSPMLRSPSSPHRVTNSLPGMMQKFQSATLSPRRSPRGTNGDC